MTRTVSSPTDHAARLPTFSVVVPNYNHAHYLEAALQAHLTQKEPPLEIIVVDDASTDDSCSVIERVAAQHPSVRLVRLPRNGGVNAAINRGLQETRGDYVCFSAADDLVAKDFAARSLEILARYPSEGFCFSDPAELQADSGIVRRFPLYLSDRPCMLPPRDVERLLAHNYFSFSSNTILYRREAIVAAGGFVEDLRWYADWFANYVLAFRHGVCYVPEVLAYFRVSEGSYSAQGVRQAAVQRDLLYRMLDLLKEDSFRDVAGCFRRAAIVPEVRVRALLWLIASSRHRGYLGSRLCIRLLFNGIWLALLPYMPVVVRRMARWLVGMPTRWQVSISKENG